MELKITEQKENKILGRKEVSASATFTGPTPSNQAVVGVLAKQVGASAECIRMQSIYGKFGHTTAQITAHVYTSKEQLDKIEPKIKEKKEE